MKANTNKLNFYVSDVVRKKLEKLSKDSGLTMTAVITRLISEREIHPLKTDELLKIYNELNHIGNDYYNKQRFRFCGKTEVLLKNIRQRGAFLYAFRCLYERTTQPRIILCCVALLLFFLCIQCRKIKKLLF